MAGITPLLYIKARSSACNERHSEAGQTFSFSERIKLARCFDKSSLCRIFVPQNKYGNG